MSNLAWFKYAWVWDKVNPSGFLNARLRPLKSHEDIVVFANGSSTYNPQMVTTPESERRMRRGSHELTGKPQEHKGVYRDGLLKGNGYRGEQSLPISLITITTGGPWVKKYQEHPTQKPVPLYAYLIRTYTHPGAMVLDFCMGSGTTGVACVQTGRNFIGIELDPGYFAIAQKRIEAAQAQPALFAEAAT
jgi:site-specific DNA-methyltransferase (adenine-specific)